MKPINRLVTVTLLALSTSAASQRPDPLMEKAWSCVPIFGHPGEIRFRKKKCQDPATPRGEVRAMAEAVMQRFHKRGVAYEFDIDAYEKESLERAGERGKKLKDGRLRPEDMYDVTLMHTPVSELGEIMAQPLLQPDKKTYVGVVHLEGLEREGVLRARRSVGRNDIVYAILRTSKAQVLNPELMRVGAQVQVLGRYVGNQKYRTLAGTERMAPVIEVTHIGEPAI